jgi:hypothetical protein
MKLLTDNKNTDNFLIFFVFSKIRSRKSAFQYSAKRSSQDQRVPFYQIYVGETITGKKIKISPIDFTPITIIDPFSPMVSSLISGN